MSSRDEPIQIEPDHEPVHVIDDDDTPPKRKHIDLSTDSDGDEPEEPPRKKKGDGKKPGHDARARDFRFTWNNYTVATEEFLATIDCQYICYGREVAPTTGTPHLQGYIYFKNARKWSTVQKKLKGADIGHCDGTPEQNIKYCQKDGDFHERGIRPKSHQQKGQMEKERWANIAINAKAGRMDIIEEEEPKTFITHYRTLKAIATDNMRAPDDLPGVCGIWVWGVAGTGKTTWAREAYPGAYIKDRTKWWDGYQGQEAAICDDFDPFCKGLAGLVKDWGDKWTFKAEHKNGYKWIRPKKFIITSQYHPDEIWQDEETRAAIKRRYEVHHMHQSGEVDISAPARPRPGRKAPERVENHAPILWLD